MATVTTLKAIAGYFNAKDSENHKPLREFASEIKELSDDEKKWFAEEICKITGEILSASA